MKKTHFYYLCLCALFLTSCSSGVQKITLNGSFTGLNQDTLYLSCEKPFEEGDDPIRPQYIEDTIVLKEGKFSLNKEIPEPSHFRLAIKKGGRPRDFVGFFLSEGLTEVIGKDSALTDFEIKGQAEQKNYEAYDKQTSSVHKQRDSIYHTLYVLRENYDKLMSTHPEAKQSGARLPKALKSKIDAYNYEQQSLRDALLAKKIERQRIDSAYIVENKNTYLAVNLLAWFMNEGILPKNLQHIIQQLDEKFKNSHILKKIKALEKEATRLAVGQPAPDFTMPTDKDSSLSLSSLKGKIVMLDFWASWCQPCRYINPKLVELYEKKYKNNDKIAFLSVSLDHEKNKWLEAIAKDKLEWLHVCNLKGWESEAVKLYNVLGVPTTFIIDAQGNIAANNISFEVLEKTLDSLLK